MILILIGFAKEKRKESANPLPAFNLWGYPKSCALRYLFRHEKSRLSQYKQDRLIELVADMTAKCVSELMQVNKNTSTHHFHRLWLIIYEYQQQFESTLFEGKIKVDESYFGGYRKGKRGRGVRGPPLIREFMG